MSTFARIICRFPLSGPLGLTEVQNLRPVDVFIHSSPHSGSTWLGYVLGSGGETAFVGELYRAWDAQDRVPCTICASRGLQDCVLLGGIEHADPTSAFSTISERNRKRIIVDNSKRIEFTSHFIGRPDRDLKVVHLVKDPRSRWASLRRREPFDLDRCMDDWWTENNEIRQFTAARKIQTITVAYDIVAADPELELPAIFEFFGSSFSSSVLRYWEVDHHGYAANGASSSIIRHQNFSSPPAHFSTGDDLFYKAGFGRSFVDERWRSELPSGECEAILGSGRITSLLESLGFQLTPSGLERRAAQDGPLRRTAGSWAARLKSAIGF